MIEIENRLADSLGKSPPLAKLFCQLLNDPLGLDPANHPALELATPEHDTFPKQGDAKGVYSLEVYLRIVRLSRERSTELLEAWRDRYPVDWWHIEAKRQALEGGRPNERQALEGGRLNDMPDDMVSWIYAGATIAATGKFGDIKPLIYYQQFIPSTQLSNESITTRPIHQTDCQGSPVCSARTRL